MRGLTLGTVCALLSIAGHEIGGGRVSAAGIFFVVGLFGLIGVVVADQELQTGRLTMLVLGSALLGHVVLICTHHAHGSSASAAGHYSAATMIVGHVLAALAVAWLLREGEASIFAWSRFLGQRIGAALVAAIVIAMRFIENVHSATATATDAFDDPLTLGGTQVCSSVSRRGPPVFA